MFCHFLVSIVYGKHISSLHFPATICEFNQIVLKKIFSFVCVLQVIEKSQLL